MGSSPSLPSSETAPNVNVTPLKANQNNVANSESQSRRRGDSSPNSSSEQESYLQRGSQSVNDTEQRAQVLQKVNEKFSSEKNIHDTGNVVISLPNQSQTNRVNSKMSPEQQLTDQRALIVDTIVSEDENERKRKESLKSKLVKKVNEITNITTTKSYRPKMQSDESKRDLNALEEIVKRLQQKRQKLVSLQEVKLTYLNRLSEIASVRLRHNNPDIADLSDDNRATKLAEKLSELYDNEWTDVFEMTKKNSGNKVTDKDIAVSLRNILKFCYKKCQEMSESQRQKVLMALCMSGETKDKEVSADMRFILKVFQKDAADSSVLYVQKVISTRIYNDEPLKNDVIVKKVGKELCNLYINSCTKISWHTQIHDPPLVLDFKGGVNPTASFRPYTSSGTILDYVLWPAMLLHEGGPIVAKGVSQFSKQSEKETEVNSENGLTVPMKSDLHDLAHV